MIGIVAGDELTVVEADAIIKQQLDVIHDDRTAVLVDRILQLNANFLHTFYNRPSFLFGKVQGFVGIVRKI